MTTFHHAAVEALKKWVAVREKIFAYDGIPPREFWDELGDAEHELMKKGRELINEEG